MAIDLPCAEDKSILTVAAWEELLKRIWGTDYVGETRTVDVHIGQLRKKLGFHDVIRTISKTGYRLEDLE